jgi:hypothetical protein
MSDPQAAGTKATDPLEQWRDLRDAYIDIWAKASGEAVNSEAYAQASGTMLEAFLSTSSPFRDAQKKAMVSALEQCNMPSRDDYLRMAERMANLELLLDDMDARLRQLYRLVAGNAKPPAPQSVPHQSAKVEPFVVKHEPARLETVPESRLETIPVPEAKPEAVPVAVAEPALFSEVEPAETAPKAAKKSAHKTPAKISKKGSK